MFDNWSVIVLIGAYTALCGLIIRLTNRTVGCLLLCSDLGLCFWLAISWFDMSWAIFFQVFFIRCLGAAGGELLFLHFTKKGGEELEKRKRKLEWEEAIKNREL